MEVFRRNSGNSRLRIVDNDYPLMYDPPLKPALPAAPDSVIKHALKSAFIPLPSILTRDVIQTKTGELAFARFG